MGNERNPPLRNYGTNQGQYSYYVLRGYFQDDVQIREALMDCKVRHYAYILHDEDTYNDDTETHAKGDPKKAHYHIILNLSSKQTFAWVRRKFERVSPDCGLYLKNMADNEGAFDYLTHTTESAIKAGKHKYPYENIKSDDPSYWHSEDAKQGVHDDNTDWTLTFSQEVLEYGYCTRACLQKYACTIGRDFLFNYRRVLSFCADVLRISIDEIFIDPEERYNTDKRKASLETVVAEMQQEYLLLKKTINELKEP